MSGSSGSQATVVALWRYPLKSMQGEELNSAQVSARGIWGDRAYALIDAAEGKIASAKNPKKWPAMFDCRATFVAPPELVRPLPPVRITLPDGSQLQSDDASSEARLSGALGRAVRLASSPPVAPCLEEYWPDVEGLPRRDDVTSESIPEGSFFDCALVHLLTTATLDRLRECAPGSRFEVRRFRPNVVVSVPGAGAGFVENAWIGRTLAIGPEVRLQVTGPCPRCVMTTLPQSDLPADPAILRTAVAHNGGHVGVYASVVHGGAIRRGDPLKVE
jgi:uncharacterized protein YcbX